VLTSCSVFNSNCEQLCLDRQVIAEMGGGTFDETRYRSQCAQLGRASCSDCWEAVGELLAEEYNALPDCYCMADNPDPDVYDNPFHASCDEMIDDRYAGDRSLFEADCSCSD